MSSVCVIQSNYIPWKGYFDLIGLVDWFVVYDHVQFTKNDWRNRNLIKTRSGLKWLTVPVGQDIRRRIKDVEIPTGPWRRKHWAALEAAYGRAPHARRVFDMLEPVYLGPSQAQLSKLNVELLRRIADFLGIRVRFIDSGTFDLPPGKTEPLVHICSELDAIRYVSGPAARAYLDVARFEARGISVQWFDYSGYPEYPQLWGAFEHGVSILDLLFNCGEAAREYMKLSDSLG